MVGFSFSELRSFCEDHERTCSQSADLTIIYSRFLRRNILPNILLSTCHTKPTMNSVTATRSTSTRSSASENNGTRTRSLQPQPQDIEKVFESANNLPSIQTQLHSENAIETTNKHQDLHPRASTLQSLMRQFSNTKAHSLSFIDIERRVLENVGQQNEISASHNDSFAVPPLLRKGISAKEFASIPLPSRQNLPGSYYLKTHTNDIDAYMDIQHNKNRPKQVNKSKPKVDAKTRKLDIDQFVKTVDKNSKENDSEASVTHTPPVASSMKILPDTMAQSEDVTTLTQPVINRASTDIENIILAGVMETPENYVFANDNDNSGVNDVQDPDVEDVMGISMMFGEQDERGRSSTAGAPRLSVTEAPSPKHLTPRNSHPNVPVATSRQSMFRREKSFKQSETQLLPPVPGIRSDIDDLLFKPSRPHVAPSCPDIDGLLQQQRQQAFHENDGLVTALPPSFFKQRRLTHPYLPNNRASPATLDTLIPVQMCFGGEVVSTQSTKVPRDSRVILGSDRRMDISQLIKRGSISRGQNEDDDEDQDDMNEQHAKDQKGSTTKKNGKRFLGGSLPTHLFNNSEKQQHISPFITKQALLEDMARLEEKLKQLDIDGLLEISRHSERLSPLQRVNEIEAGAVKAHRDIGKLIGEEDGSMKRSRV